MNASIYLRLRIIWNWRRDNIRNITINLPDLYIKLLNDIGLKYNESRSALVRRAIRDYLMTDEIFQASLERIKEESKKKTIKQFYNYCINCDNEIKSQTESLQLKHPNINIFDLRFCCSCFAMFENLPLDEWPKEIIQKIWTKIKEYKASLSWFWMLGRLL